VVAETEFLVLQTTPARLNAQVVGAGEAGFALRLSWAARAGTCSASKCSVAVVDKAN
jgi:hypothetical protein